MQTAVEQIKDRLPITDILSSYITLIPAGKQFKAKCPFHNERSASFSISPDRGLYYCFGCGAKGDIFTFVQQFEGVDFNGALKILAERAGVELKAYDQHRDDTAPLYECLEKTTQRYQNELQKNNEALLYLKGRGITPETIMQFRIGYAPAEWRFVSSFYTIDLERGYAERVGLIKRSDKGEKEQGYYDRFRGRIMFPIMDTSGRVIGFSGRLFPEQSTSPAHQEHDAPKYLNSPETELFQKSRVLYGFDKAKFPIKRHNFAILVEGQMDLLMSHQAGFRNTVATSGTAVSEQSAEDAHANLVMLSRLTPHLFLAFDGDSAGQKALSRAALVALSLGMNPKVVPVPIGEDPAEYILREGPEQWKSHLQSSQHFIIHQAQKVKQAGYSPHMLVRALREEVFPYLARVVSPIEQNLYIEKIAKQLGIDSHEIVRELARFIATLPKENSTVSNVSTGVPSTGEDITPRERLAGFITYFKNDVSQEKITSIEEMVFEEYSFGRLTLPEERFPIVLAVIERDYGTLSEQERLSVLEELIQHAEIQFFSEIRIALSTALYEAEQKGDEKTAEKLLTTLTIINKRRHGQP